MPTKYRPSLDHTGFDWTKDLEKIQSKLRTRWEAVLTALQFAENPRCFAIADSSGADSSGGVTLSTERDDLFREISGLLALAAAIQMDAGFKAANKVIATVDAVIRNPSIVKKRNVEPEALGVIALHYQRADEPPGTHWRDIYQDEGTQAVDLPQVVFAARRARLQLRAERKAGRPKRSAYEPLANLREIFERYNPKAARHSVLTSVDGKLKQEEAGPYLAFLKEATAPLNEFLAELPDTYDVKLISPAQIMRTKVNHNRRRSPDAVESDLAGNAELDKAILNAAEKADGRSLDGRADIDAVDVEQEPAGTR